MYRHLVTVEVGVESGADQRMDTDSLTLDEHRFECLDAQAVQGGRPVEQDRVLLYHFLEDVPNDRDYPFDHPLGSLYVMREAQIHQALHHERLEQLERHLLGQPALMKLELRPHNDDGPA